ncbi:MAG: helix-turn-helix transcriptional regulator [Lachnospiraceae bacterium]|nr:helix-turn-helix transcriptional regulator [Lachnospiraceae bacterium]
MNAQTNLNNREKSNISKSDLAGRMEVTRQSVTLWENGKRKPGTKHLEWLSRFYGIDEKWFGDLSEGDMWLCINRYFKFIQMDQSFVRSSALSMIISDNAYGRTSSGFE